MEYDKIKIVMRKISELKEYDKNTKQHPKKQVKKIANSIQEYGFNVPLIIDKDNSLIAGHGRLLAAKTLNMKELPCILKENLTPNQVKSFRIADNKTAESNWIDDFLKDEISDLKEADYDTSLTGFDESELDKLFDTGDDKLFDETEEVDKLGSHVITCPKCDHKFKKGDKQ